MNRLSFPINKSVVFGADCGCGGSCGLCGPRLEREFSHRLSIIKDAVLQLPTNTQSKDEKQNNSQISSNEKF